MHPDGLIRSVRIPLQLTAGSLPTQNPYAVRLALLADLVWWGLIPMYFYARETSLPYTRALVQRAGAGVISACEPEEDGFAAEMQAVAKASGGPVSLELSALVVAGLLPHSWGVLMQSFSVVELPANCTEDIAISLEQLTEPGAETAGPAIGRSLNGPTYESRDAIVERIRQIEQLLPDLRATPVNDLSAAQAVLGALFSEQDPASRRSRPPQQTVPA